MSLIFEQFDPPTTCAEADTIIAALMPATPNASQEHLIDVFMKFLPSFAGRAVRHPTK